MRAEALQRQVRLLYQLHPGATQMSAIVTSVQFNRLNRGKKGYFGWKFLKIQSMAGWPAAFEFVAGWHVKARACNGGNCPSKRQSSNRQ